MDMKDTKIGVIGLGYVGLPLARLFSTKFPTVGFDMNQRRVDALMAGHDATLEVSDDLLQEAINKHGFRCTATLDDTTFAGAIESMFKAALARFPDKKIGYVFIHKCASGYDSRVPNSYYGMAKSACEKWGIPYLDLNTQVPPLNYIADLKSTYTANGDGYHPNELGYRTFYVPKITAFLNTMLTDNSLINKIVTENGTYLATDDSADGYSSVTVNVPSGSSKNVQTAQSTTRRNNTALGSIISLTCQTAGTYDVYWTCARSNTSQTWGSQLYINGTAYGTENTTWSNNVQNNHLTGVVLSANDTVAVYGRSRSGYYIHAPQLTIVQTA